MLEQTFENSGANSEFDYIGQSSFCKKHLEGSWLILDYDTIEDIKVINITNNTLENDRQIKSEQVKGILKNKISNPMGYQRALRDEWERK